MFLTFYQALHQFNDGLFFSKLLHNRGRSRHIISRDITRLMQFKLSLLRSGNLKLPTSGNMNCPPISLTSWQPRFKSLPLVLLNLLEQDLLPSRIIVWLDKKGYDMFDPVLRKLFKKSIVEFHKVKNFGPHKKWLPLTLSGDEPFVICDDDIFYANTWYRRLIESDDQKNCIAHRCHRFKVSKTKNILPYDNWDKDIPKASEPAHNLFPVGCGGVLIYPDRIANRFRNWETISRVCPKNDDIWLKLAHLDSGFCARKTQYISPCIEYLDSQSVGLIQSNVNLKGNDVQINDSLKDLELDLQFMNAL